MYGIEQLFLENGFARIAGQLQEEEASVRFRQVVVRWGILTQHLDNKLLATQIRYVSRQPCATPYETQEQRAHLTTNDNEDLNQNSSNSNLIGHFFHDLPEPNYYGIVAFDATVKCD